MFLQSNYYGILELKRCAQSNCRCFGGLHVSCRTEFAWSWSKI